MIDQSKNNNSLTEEEAEIYDRQIRLWGVEAQQRLRKAKILMVGLSSLGNEISKNVLLAGVKHMTLLDDKTLTKEDCDCQFLSSFDMIGKNRAESCLNFCRELNPMVDIVTDTECVDSKSDEFFKNFDVVCMADYSGELQEKVNSICHRLGIRFLSGNVFGYYGYVFADFGHHKYMQEQPKKVLETKSSDGASSAKKVKKQDVETEVIEKVSTFCSLTDAMSVQVFHGKSLRQAKQVTKAYLVMKVLFEFCKRYNGYPSKVTSQKELEKLLDVRNDVFEHLQIDNDLLPDDFVSYCTGALYPVNAVVGGIMAQEVIKAISYKDAPHNNFFFYDGVLTSGTVEKISPASETKPVADEKSHNAAQIVL